MALATCRWLCNNNSNGGKRQKSVKNACNGLQGLYNMASTPIFQLHLVCQLMREIFFFFLSFRFAGKFNSCGNSVNLKGAAQHLHTEGRERGRGRRPLWHAQFASRVHCIPSIDAGCLIRFIVVIKLQYKLFEWDWTTFELSMKWCRCSEMARIWERIPWESFPHFVIFFL